MATEAQKRAVRKYDSANTIHFKLKLNIKTDAEIIEYIKQKANFQGYIKQLIKQDMEGEKI